MADALVTRVLVTRPEPGATRTLNALQAVGIDAAAIALTEISRVHFELPTGDFDMLMITSQNAVSHGTALLKQFFTTPVFVVGKRTSEALAGHTIAAWAENAEELLPKIIIRAPKRVLFLCGQTRRPELESGLKSAGIHVEVVEVYGADPNRRAPAQLRIFFQSSENTIVLFHAPSAALAFISAINVNDVPQSTRFLCMSDAIAAALPVQFQNQITIANHPDEAAMLEQLDKMLASDHMPKA